MPNINFKDWVTGLTAASSISGADSVPIVQGGATKKIDPTLITPFAKDVNGNYIADIVPRTGTLATLLAVTNAGNGEIASATDIDALVKYTGNSPSVGKAYFKNDWIGTLEFRCLGDTAIANGQVIQLDPASLQVFGPISSNSSLTSTLINNTSSSNNYIDFTNIVNSGLGNNYRVEMRVKVNWPADPTFDGARRGITAQQGTTPTSFSAVDIWAVSFVAGSNVTISTPMFTSLNITSSHFMRVLAAHNATVLPTVSGTSNSLQQTQSGFSIDVFAFG